MDFELPTRLHASGQLFEFPQARRESPVTVITGLKSIAAFLTVNDSLPSPVAGMVDYHSRTVIYYDAPIPPEIFFLCLYAGKKKYSGGRFCIVLNTRTAVRRSEDL